MTPNTAETGDMAISRFILLLILLCITATIAANAQPRLQPADPSAGEKLRVHFIDVENGDAILIDLGETEVLIDGGLPDSGVADYLKDYVDGPLEAMVATHPHPDHIGGLVEVLEAFDVNDIWLNGDTVSQDFRFYRIFEKFTGLVNAEGAVVHEARGGQTINIGILSFLVLHPDNLASYGTFQDRRSTFQTMNNNSIVLRLRYGEMSFLFAGDVHKECEANMLKAGVELRSDILKVGHHGSIWSSSFQFLHSVSPQVAIYMAPKRFPQRGPKKPHPDTIAALEKAGAKVYGTNTHGTIIITTDGKTFTIATEQ